MDQKITRFNQRMSNFKRSLHLLVNQAKQDRLDPENIAATLHFFEMTFELGWKLLKDFLEVQGIPVKSPRETLKTGFNLGYLHDGHTWIDMLDARNSIAHAYEEEMALALFKSIKQNYVPLLQTLEQLSCGD